MCGKKPVTPKVIERDPIAEQRKAEADATIAENKERASTSRRRRKSSLLTLGAAGTGERGKSLLAQATPDGP